MATLTNPSTGARQAVSSGSEEAQKLFGQGFVLEGSPEQQLARSMSVPTSQPTQSRQLAPIAAATKQPTELDLLNNQISDLRKNLMSSYQPTAEEQLLRDRISGVLDTRDSAVSELEKLAAGLSGQGRGISLGLVTGQQGAVLDQARAEDAQKTAEANALNRALESMVADRTGMAEAQMNQLGFLESDVERLLGQQMADQQTQAQEAAKLESLAIQAIQGGASSELAQQIMQSQDLASALGLAGSHLAPSQSVDPVKLGSGDILVDPVTGERIAINPKTSEYDSLPSSPTGKTILPTKEALSLNKEIASSDEFAALGNANTVWSTLGNYEELFNKYGNQKYGAEASELKSAYTATLLEMKEMFNLGVLNGPDLELMEKVLVNPNVNAFTDPLIFASIGGEKGIKAGIDQARGL
jgi:hypothetical protein